MDIRSEGGDGPCSEGGYGPWSEGGLTWSEGGGPKVSVSYFYRQFHYKVKVMVMFMIIFCGEDLSTESAADWRPRLVR